MEKDLRLGCFDSLFCSLGESGAGHAFARTAFFEVEQFTQTGAGHAGELDFGFFGRAGGFAAFEDVLLALGPDE